MPLVCGNILRPASLHHCNGFLNLAPTVLNITAQYFAFFFIPARTNPELETQWSELRELGEQYRKLEQHILDKQATFDRVRAMPAPEVD